MSDPCVYAIRRTDTRDCYIGSTVDISCRLRTHMNKLRKNTHINNRLQGALNKYGPDAFNTELLEIVRDRSRLTSREQWWLDHVEHAYNLHTQAHIAGLSHVVSNETREKLRQANLGKKRGPMSDEEKHKRSVAMKGKNRGPRSLAAKQKMSLAHKGKTLPEEQKKKIAASMANYIKTEAHCKNISEGWNRLVSTGWTRNARR